MNYFRYGGTWSSEYGLYITGTGIYDAPERDIESISIPGRNGDLIVDNGRFQNLDVTYSGFTRGVLAERARKIKAWLLSGRGYRELTDTYDSRYFRRALFRGPINVEATIGKYGQADLVFNCHPMRYLVDGQEPITLTAGRTLYNPELFPSLPYMRVYGSGTAALYIGNQVVNFSSIDGFTELDSEMQNAYKGSVNKNGTVTMAEFPTLLPGENAVSWYGGITKIEITPRWCTL